MPLPQILRAGCQNANSPLGSKHAVNNRYQEERRGKDRYSYRLSDFPLENGIEPTSRCNSPNTGSLKLFADVPVSHPYYRQIMAAYMAGILSGSIGGDGRLYFYPYSSASRNHVAKMTARLIEYIETI